MIKGNRKIIFFPLLGWGSALIHRDQMLAQGLAKRGEKVIFLNRISRRPWQLLLNKKYIARDNLEIVDVFTLPYLKGRFPLIYKVNDWLLIKQLGKYQINDNDILYLTNPDWAVVVATFKAENLTIYDISDDFVALAKNVSWGKMVGEYDNKAKIVADRFVVTNEELASEAVRKKVWQVISNGVDLASFIKAKKVIDKGSFEKLAGFIGGIYEWIDLDLIRETAERFPNILFVLIGPTNRTNEIIKLEKIKNIRYLGIVEKTKVCDYFSSLDIGLVPYVSLEKYPRLKTVDSNKIYQYLYFGYPVVSTDYPQVQKMQDLVFVSRSREEFFNNIERALKAETYDERKKYALTHSWESKVEELIKFLEN